MCPLRLGQGVPGNTQDAVAHGEFIEDAVRVLGERDPRGDADSGMCLHRGHDDRTGGGDRLDVFFLSLRQFGLQCGEFRLGLVAAGPGVVGGSLGCHRCIPGLCRSILIRIQRGVERVDEFLCFRLTLLRSGDVIPTGDVVVICPHGGADEEGSAQCRHQRGAGARARARPSEHGVQASAGTSQIAEADRSRCRLASRLVVWRIRLRRAL